MNREKKRRPVHGGAGGKTRQATVLLAEDDAAMRSLLTGSLRSAGYRVVECSHGVDLLSHLDSFLFPVPREEIDLIISDIRMPGLTGMEVFQGLRRAEGLPPVIFITAFGSPETHREARRLGCVAVFDKPFDVDELLGAVRRAVPPRAAERRS